MKRTAIERLLPEVLRGGAAPDTPMGALLDVMEALHAPSERVLDGLDACFDPHRAEDRHVVRLARWLDLERLFARSARDDGHGREDPISTGLGRLRELVARAAELSQWRGTRHGLMAYLETATGARGWTIDEQVVGDDGLLRPFHLRVTAPPGLEAHGALIENIIELEKPAHVTYELVFTPTPG